MSITFNLQTNITRAIGEFVQAGDTGFLPGMTRGFDLVRSGIARSQYEGCL